MRVGRWLARSSWLWGVVVAIVSWPVAVSAPGGGFDPSWQVGLHLAAHEHLRFGQEIIYTYGPLGFLRFPLLAYADLARLAFLYSALVHAGLGVSLVWALRRSFGALWVAVPLAMLLSAVPLEPVVVIVAVCALGLLQSPPVERPDRWAVLAGLIAGVEILSKLNTGTQVIGICVVTAVALPHHRRWAIGLFGGSFLATVLVLWLLAGQHLGDLGDFVGSSLSVVSGYSETLGLDEPGRYWEYWAAAGLAGLGLFAALRGGPLIDRRRRVGLAAVWAVVAFLSFKQGFVRHDGHATLFFATVLGAFVGFRWRPSQRFSGALMLAIFAVAFFGSTHLDPRDLFRPLTRTKLFGQQVRLVANGSRLDRAVADARTGLARGYALDPQTYDLVRGHRVHIDPSETSLAWADQLNWRPLPMFQPFTAYTSRLDDANAATLTRRDGPDRVLRQPGTSVDNRLPGFESPAAMRALLCNFQGLRTTPTWQVLGRGAARCGRAQPLSTVSVHYGQPVPVPLPPHPGDVVILRVHGVQVSGLERLRATLFRARERFIVLDGTPHRLVPGTAADGLLLTAPPAADFPGPYRLAPNPRTISLGIVGPQSAQHARLKLSFSAVSIRPAATALRTRPAG